MLACALTIHLPGALNLYSCILHYIVSSRLSLPHTSFVTFLIITSKTISFHNLIKYKCRCAVKKKKGFQAACNDQLFFQALTLRTVLFAVSKEMIDKNTFFIQLHSIKPGNIFLVGLVSLLAGFIFCKTISFQSS